MNEKFECNDYIMDKIETEEIYGVTYAHVVSETERNVTSWIVEYRESKVEGNTCLSRNVETSGQGCSQSQEKRLA
jgi:hypothetical protein